MAIYTDLSVDIKEKGLSEDLEAIAQSVINILSTKVGERLNNPEFGVTIEDDLFRLMNVSTANIIYTKVIYAIQRWEPRVKLSHKDSSIVPDEDSHTYTVTLVYTVPTLNETSSISGTLSNAA